MDAIKASKNIRRIITGSLVVLLLWGGTLGIVGFASAGDSTEELPSTFTMPAPRVGDRAEYSITYVRDDDGSATVLEAERPHRSYEWLEPEVRYDIDGQPRHVYRLLKQWTDQDAEGEVRSGASVEEFDSTTWEMVAYAYLSEEDEEHYTGWSEQRFLVDDEMFVPDCGPINRFAGRTFDPSEPQVFFDACAWPHYWDEGVQFTGMARDTIGNTSAVYFERTDRHNDDQDIHIWLDEDVPYPLRIAQEDQDAADHFSVVRLTSFTRGDTVMAPVTPKGPAAPKMSFHAPTDVVVDDAGLDHPFPLTQAYQASIDHEEADGLRAFLELPGVHLVFADYSYEEDDDVRIHEWAMQLAAGPRDYAWLIAARDAPMADEWFLTMPDGAPRETTFDFDDERFSRTGGSGHPSKDSRPDVPSIEALAEIWAFHRDSRLADEPAQRYGFAVTCRGQDCQETQIETWYGVDRTSRTQGTAWVLPAGGEPQIQEGVFGDVRYGIDSKGVRSMGSSQSAYEFDHADQGPAAPTSDGQVATATVAYDTAVWGFPASAATIAGAGVFSFLVGALYFAWPAIKSGLGAALFSRVTEPSKLLEHPVRRRIHDLVHAEPGIHLREAQRRADIGRGALDHHVRKLCDAKVLKTVRSAGHTCLFLHGSTDHAVMEVAPAVRAKSAKKILAAADESPGGSISDLARSTGLAVATVHHHVKRLEAAGAISMDRAGAKVQVFVTPTGQKARAVAA